MLWQDVLSLRERVHASEDVFSSTFHCLLMYYKNDY